MYLAWFTVDCSTVNLTSNEVIIKNKYGDGK